MRSLVLIRSLLAVLLLVSVPTWAQSGGDAAAADKSGDKKASGKKSRGKKSSGKKSSGKKSSGKKADDKKADDKKASDKKASGKKASGKKASGKKADDKKADDKKDGDKKDGDKKDSDHKGGSEETGKLEDQAVDGAAETEAKQPGSFVDLDGDKAPTPVVHSFRGDVLNVKVGTGFAGAQSSPFGARSGYGQVFTEGDWSIGKSGVGLHWDVDLRAGLGLFEQRGGPLGLFAEPKFVYRDNTTVPNAENQPPGGVEGPGGFYRRTGIFATGRNTDYLRIDKAWLSYDIDLFGIDVGRVRVPEAQQAILDGVQIRLDFDKFRMGFFGGLRPNPFHQQVVGAASGGFVPLTILGGGAPYEYFQVAWAKPTSDRPYTASGETTGPYSNEIGTSLLNFGLPWLQLGSVRFPSVGSWFAMRFDPVFMDIGLGIDLFGDFHHDVCDEADCPQHDAQGNLLPDPAEPGSLYRTANADPLLGASPLGLDRVYLTTTGGVRVFRPLTIAWRGTLDLIGAKPLWIRDLFLDATWRNLGPVTVSASYFKINTWATALSYNRFFRPLENNQSSSATTPAPELDDQTPFEQPYDGLNNTNLFIVDRDRLKISIAAYLYGSLEAYLDLIGERRNDFVYQFQALPDAFSGLGTALSSSLTGPQLTQQFLCNQEVQRDGTGAVAYPDGQLQGSNAAYPVYTDRCKVGATLGIRDAFLGNIGQFDLHATHMQGYFSSNTRVAGRLGVSWTDRMYVGILGAVERNFVHRVYAPVCDNTGFCPPNYSPTNSTENSQAIWGYAPQPLGAYQLGLDGSVRIVGGWYLEGTYYGWVEELPYNGDYYNAAGIPQLRDPYQITHTVYFRTLYRFF